MNDIDRKYEELLKALIDIKRTHELLHHIAEKINGHSGTQEQQKASNYE